MRLLIALTSAVLVVAGCGGDDTTETGSSDTAAAADCSTALADAPFDGEGQLVSEMDAIETICTVEFSAGDEAISELGFEPTGCPPEASILVHFTLVADQLEVDRDGTMAVDNAGCIALA